jgi:Flp pilus assembly protein TadG
MKIKALSRLIYQRLQALKTTRGQSLVEMAFFFPLLLIIIAGIVEVGHTLNTYLAAANATREGARYGITVGDSSGDDQMITNVIVEAMVNKKMEVTDENTCIWLVRLETNDQDPPTGFVQWDERHVYGHACELPDEFQARLQNELGPNTRALAAWTYYKQKAMLPIPFLSSLGESIPIAPYTAMRMVVAGATSSRTDGCAIYPIALHHTTFAGAERGDIFPDIENGAGQGDFGWLAWNENPGSQKAPGIQGRLTPPGNSEDPVDGYTNPEDVDDHEVHVGDKIWGHTGAVSSSGNKDVLDDHVDTGRPLRIPIWDAVYGCDGGGAECEGDAPSGGANIAYRVWGFAVVRLSWYDLDKKMISAEFVGWDTSCGHNVDLLALGPTNTPTVTSTPTDTPTATNTPTPTDTPTNTPTPTDTPTPTNTPTNTPTSTPTSTGTATATSTVVPTSTATNTPTTTGTPGPTPTPTNTATHTPTIAPGYGNLDGYTWLRSGPVTMPWDVATITLRDHTGATVGGPQDVTNGYYSFGPLHTSGNPYTLIGTTTVSGIPFGKTEGSIFVTDQGPIMVNLVMTSPPS